MAALNFPDPNVTTTYTNPDTGITYEWSNNTWKAIRSAQTAPELFVDYDGDNMTGDLTFNTDKIVLGATFGTGTFAGNIEIGGDVSSPTAGGVEITGTGTVIANRIGNPNPVSYADCFVGRYNGVDTSEIKADGSATFTSTVTANIFESTGRNEINLADDGTGLAIQKAGATVGNLGVEGDVYKIGAIRNSTGSIEFTTKQSGVTTPKLTIANDGSATFAGGLNLGYDLASKVSVRPSALDESGIYLFEGDAGYTDSLVKAQYNQTLAGSDAKLWEGVGVVSGAFATTSTILPDGSATFAGNIDLTDSTVDLYSKTTNISSKTFQLFSDIGGTKVEKVAITANGSATFASDVAVGLFSTDGLTKGVTIRESGAVQVSSPASSANALQVIKGSVGETVLIRNDGSATFVGDVSALGYAASVGAGPNAYVFAGYNDVGADLTSSIDRYGSANFESSVTSKYSGQGKVQTAASIVHGVMVKDTGENINVTLDWDGSASFASSIGIGTMSPSYLLDAQYQPNRYFQLRYAKPYAKYDDNAMIDAFTFQNLGTTASGHGSKIEFIVGTSVSSNSSSIQAQREGAAGNTNLVFGTNSSEQMRINSDGWIGIGNNDPDSKLAIADANALEMRIRHNSNGTTVVRRDGAASYVLSESGISSNRELVFGSQSSPGGSIAEKMRIRSNGVLTWGNNPQFDVSALNAGIAFSTPGHPYIIVGGGPDTAGRYRMEFINGNGQVGTITTQGSSTSYNESSDYRLKENIVDIEDGITRVKQLQPRRFNFITDADTTVDGFIAHEAQTVVPEAVTGTRDEVDEEGNAIMQGIDKSKLVPLLTAALQEVIAKVETLEAEIAELKAG